MPPQRKDVNGDKPAAKTKANPKAKSDGRQKKKGGDSEPAEETRFECKVCLDERMEDYSNWGKVVSHCPSHTT